MSTSAATARAAAATARATPQATTFGALLRRSRLPGHAPKTVGRALAPQVYAAAAATTLDGAFAPAHDAHANVASAALVDFGLKRAVRASAGGARAATDAASVVAASQAATTVVNHHKSTAAPTIVVDELDSCHGHTRVRDASDRALRYKLAVENWSRASASTNASPSPSTSDTSSDGTASRTVSHSVASLGALDEQQFEEMLAVEVPRRRAEYDERLRAASENERLGAVASDSNEKKQEQIRKRLQLIRDVMQLRVDCVDGKMDGGDLATARRLDRGKTVGNDVDYPCTLAYHVPAVVDSSNGVENADATTATTATSDDKTATATPTTPLSPPLVKGRILNRVRDGYAVGVGGIVAFLPYPERSVVRNSGFNPDNRLAVHDFRVVSAAWSREGRPHVTLALDGAPDSVRTSVTSDGLKAALRGSGEAGRKEGDEHIEDVMSSVTEKDGISVKKAGKKTTGAKKMAADDASGVDFFDALSDLLETLDNNKQQKRPAAAATGKPASPRK